jgi:hypothetical protein
MANGAAGVDIKYGSALIITVLGLVVIALLAYGLPVKEGWTASGVTALVGAITTFLGTVVGAFLGVQVGASGREKAEDLARKALAALPPTDAARVLKD